MVSDGRMAMEEINIKQGTIEDCLQIQEQIPEFDDRLYNREDYKERLASSKSLILVATLGAKPVGFKAGYALDSRCFYSWMGAVLPQFRQLKIAKNLADYQEQWAKKQGFEKVRFKTRNELKPMLIFALKNGFFIAEFSKREPIQKSRIILEKIL